MLVVSGQKSSQKNGVNFFFLVDVLFAQLCLHAVHSTGVLPLPRLLSPPQYFHALLFECCLHVPLTVLLQVKKNFSSNIILHCLTELNVCKDGPLMGRLIFKGVKGRIHTRRVGKFWLRLHSVSLGRRELMLHRMSCQRVSWLKRWNGERQAIPAKKRHDIFRATSDDG